MVTWVIIGGMTLPMSLLNDSIYVPFLYSCILYMKDNMLNKYFMITQVRGVY